MAIIRTRNSAPRARRAVSRRTRTATVQSVGQVVKSVLGQNLEHKRANLLNGGTSTTAGTIFSLSQFITEGDGISQRTGRLINMIETTLRYTRVVNSITNNTSILRSIVFLDTQNQGVIPAVTDVLTAADPISGYEVQNAQQHRFRILHDEFESLCASSTTHRKASTWVIPSKYQIHYGGSTDVAASNRKNALFFLIITNNAVAGPDVTFGVQHRYTDA